MRFKILRRISKGTWQTLIKSVEILIAFLGVSFGLVVWRLYAEPLDAAFLLPELTKRMIPDDVDMQVSVDSIMLTASLKAQGLFHLDIHHLTIKRSDGTEMISLPSVEMSYGLKNILTLDYVPQTIQVEKAIVRLVIDEEGRLFLMNKQEHETKKDSKEVAAQPEKNHMFRADFHALIRYFKSFDYLGIQDASLSIDDRQKKETFSIPEFNMVYEKELGFRHSLQGAIVLRANDSLINMGLEAEMRELSNELSFEVVASPIRLNRLARFFPELAEVDLSVKATLNGVLDFNRFVRNPRYYVSELKFQLESVKEGVISLPSPLTNRYRIRSLLLNGRFDPDLTGVHIDKSYAVLKEGIKAKIAVDTTGLDDYWETGDVSRIQTVVTSRIEDIPIKFVPQVWPADLGADAHAWVADNLTAGFAPQGDFQLTLQGGRLTDVKGKIIVQDVSVRYLPEIPEIQGVNGEVLLSLDQVIIHAQSGKQDDIQLQKADVYLMDLDQDKSYAKIDLQARGPVQDAMRIISYPPLEFAQAFNLDPEQTGGFTTVALSLRFPLTETLSVSDVDVNLTADIIDGIAAIPQTPLTLTDGQLALTVKTEGLHLTGTGKVNQIPLTLDWRESFTANKSTDVRTTLALNTAITDGELQMLWPDMPPCVRGQIVGDVSLKQLVTGDMSGEASLNFTEAKVEIQPLALTKEIGEEMTFHGQYTLSADKTKGFLKGKVLGQAEGAPLRVNGSVGWGDKIQLDLVELVAKGTDVSLMADIEAGQNFGLYVRGKSLDLSGLFGDKKEEKTAVTLASDMSDSVAKIPNVQEQPVSVSLDIRLDQLILNPNLPLQNIMILGERQGYFWQDFSMEAQGAVPFRADFDTEHRSLKATTSDLGDLLNRLNLTDRISGGELILRAEQPVSGGLLGTIDVKNFNFQDPGFFVQAFTILGIVDALRGKELHFDKAEVPFELTPYQTMFITEGYAYGTTLGITVTGRARVDALDLNGSVIPAYAVNSLLGKIPLIGQLFRDGEGGGLVGVKYLLTGSVQTPEISFNTLSSMAPGIIGKLFQ